MPDTKEADIGIPKPVDDFGNAGAKGGKKRERFGVAQYNGEERLSALPTCIVVGEVL